jgi:hypothetical protein
MALDMLFRMLGTPTSKTQIGAITLDAAITDTHEFSAEVTNHPLETGSSITDHVFLNPDRLTIEGEVTNSPVQIFGGILSGGFSGLSDRRVEAFEELIALNKARAPITVVTGLAVYKNMVLNNLKVPRDTNTGQRLLFTAEFQRVTFVETKNVEISQDKTSKPDQAASKQDAGSQTTKDATTTQTNKSLAVRGIDAIKGALH